MQTAGRRRARYGRFAAASALAALTGCTLTHAPSPTPPSTAKAPFLLTFWCGPPLADFDDARAAEIAAAGFTVVGAPCQGGFDAALNRRALDIAQRHGLRVLVHDHRFAPAASSAPDWPASAQTAVAEYANHPALAGYFVDDEPTVNEFEPVAAAVAALRAADPLHLAYVNLLPDYIPPAALGAPSYEDYVEQFITTVRPQLLSYDYYPFGCEKDRSTFFANLAVMRAAALRHDLPFMLIVLAMPHGPYRDPSEAELAWQVHHALAYGARGVSYFTYWTPPGDGEWNNRYGLIENGRPTAHYFQVARLNRELQALSAALDRFESFAVADSLGEIGVPFPIGPIDGIDGGPITAGLFGDGSGRLAVLLVNRDYRYGVTARLRLRADATAPQAFDVDTARWEPAPTLSFVLPPGGSRLLGWGMNAARRA
jgi:hypothetical protein